jgi:hypothetical protein
MPSASTFNYHLHRQADSAKTYDSTGVRVARELAEDVTRLAVV